MTQPSYQLHTHNGWALSAGAGLTRVVNPALLGARGVGAETAAALLVAAGDNPDRMRSEASFAALCGTSPIEASSGPIVRHRLNRGGNRHANNALWRIAMVRLRVDERSIAYAARLTAEGKTRRETLRCLKRHIAREAYKLITDPPDVASGADLRRQRTRQGLTIRCTAQALGAAPNRISELERGIIHNCRGHPRRGHAREPRQAPLRQRRHHLDGQGQGRGVLRGNHRVVPRPGPRRPPSGDHHRQRPGPLPQRLGVSSREVVCS